MITRGQIMNEIWTRLSKTATTPGFYTALKVQSVIQESVDFLAAEQILADEGYCHKLDYLAPAPGARPSPSRPMSRKSWSCVT